MDAARSRGASPSNGHPKLVEMMTSHTAPSPWVIAISSASASDSSVPRLATLRGLWVSDAETHDLELAEAGVQARRAPRELGAGGGRGCPGSGVMAAHTSSASAICGIALGCRS